MGHALGVISAVPKLDVRAFANGADLFDAIVDCLAREQAPDVLIVDDDLVGYGGINAAASVRRAGYRTAIVLLASPERAPVLMRSAYKLDAHVVQRPITTEALLSVIERARLVERGATSIAERERRRWPRVPVKVVAEVRIGQHGRYAGMICDVSLAGMTLEVGVSDAGRLGIGSTLEIGFDVDRESVSIPAVVLRRSDPFTKVELGVWLELDDANPLQRELYGHWLLARVESFVRARAREHMADAPA